MQLVKKWTLYVHPQGGTNSHAWRRIEVMAKKLCMRYWSSTPTGDEDKKGLTAMEVVRGYGKEAVREVLKQHTNDIDDVDKDPWD